MLYLQSLQEAEEVFKALSAPMRLQIMEPSPAVLSAASMPRRVRSWRVA